MVTAEEAFAEHQLQHVHLASHPLLTVNTRPEQHAAAVLFTDMSVLLHIFLRYSHWQACHCLWLQVWLMIQIA